MMSYRSIARISTRSAAYINGVPVEMRTRRRGELSRGVMVEGHGERPEDTPLRFHWNAYPSDDVEGKC